MYWFVLHFDCLHCLKIPLLSQIVTIKDKWNKNTNFNAALNATNSATCLKFVLFQNQIDWNETTAIQKKTVKLHITVQCTILVICVQVNLKITNQRIGMCEDTNMKHWTLCEIYSFLINSYLNTHLIRHSLLLVSITYNDVTRVVGYCSKLLWDLWRRHLIFPMFMSVIQHWFRTTLKYFRKKALLPNYKWCHCWWIPFIIELLHKHHSCVKRHLIATVTVWVCCQYFNYRRQFWQNLSLSGNHWRYKSCEFASKSLILLSSSHRLWRHIDIISLTRVGNPNKSVLDVSILKVPALFVTGEMTYYYSEVMMKAMASQITGVSIVYSTVWSGTDKKNTKAPRHWSLWGEINGDRWDPRRKGQ